MNTPNKLTVARIILSPLFLLFMLWEFPHHYVVALVIFIAAALTDLFDGQIARRKGLITNLGKFLDPLADKMLTTAAFLAFMVCGPTNKSAIWAVMIVLTREFMVMSVRLLAARDGIVVAASFAGKLKTVAQFFSIIYMILALEFNTWQHTVLASYNLSDKIFSIPVTIGWGFIWISVVLTLISGIQYVWALRHYFTQEDTQDTDN